MSNVSNEYNEALLEPLKYYRESLKDTFQGITEDISRFGKSITGWY